MKKILLTILLAVAFCVPAFATVKQVTNVGATASTILTAGNAVHTIIIQNNGSGNVRLSIDGATAPTATTGYRLLAGNYIILTYPGFKGPPVIKAILETGTTTTLDIITDDTDSS